MFPLHPISLEHNRGEVLCMPIPGQLQRSQPALREAAQVPAVPVPALPSRLLSPPQMNASFQPACEQQGWLLRISFHLSPKRKRNILAFSCGDVPGEGLREPFCLRFCLGIQ